MALTILPIKAVDQFLDRRLQGRWIIDFHDQLPARRWNHGAIERHGDFSTQWSCHVVQYVDSGLRFEFSEVLREIRIAASRHLEDFFHNASWILDYRRRHHAGIRRYKLE